MSLVARPAGGNPAAVPGGRGEASRDVIALSEKTDRDPGADPAAQRQERQVVPRELAPDSQARGHRGPVRAEGGGKGTEFRSFGDRSNKHISSSNTSRK